MRAALECGGDTEKILYKLGPSRTQTQQTGTRANKEEPTSQKR